jgi:group II intron reverse transcriptase/maturase
VRQSTRIHRPLKVLCATWRRFWERCASSGSTCTIRAPQSSRQSGRRAAAPGWQGPFFRHAADPTFSEASFGFQPQRSAHQAVARAQAFIASGHGVVVDLDLEKFFDRVNHDILMGLVAKRVTDKRILRLVRGFLTAGVLIDGLVSQTEEGTPQGGPLSPLLSNLMLDVLDKELEKRGHRFVRYADDCNIYVRSQRAGERVMASIEGFLAKRLMLKVNKAKSAVAAPRKRKFLGFSFTIGSAIKRRLAPQTVARFKARVREVTRRTRGKSLAQMIEELARYLTGWRAYFGFCETPSVLRELDQWTRRRLRAVVWKQWKRGRTRFAELTRRGVGWELAAMTAGKGARNRLERESAISSRVMPDRMCLESSSPDGPPQSAPPRPGTQCMTKLATRSSAVLRPSSTACSWSAQNCACRRAAMRRNSSGDASIAARS